MKLKKLSSDFLSMQESQSDFESKEDSLCGHILVVEDNKTNQMLLI